MEHTYKRRGNTLRSEVDHMRTLKVLVATCGILLVVWAGIEPPVPAHTTDGVQASTTTSGPPDDRVPEIVDGAAEPFITSDASTTAGTSGSCASGIRVREDLAIPTLDGHALSAFVDRPSGPPCPLPTILIQTPYNKEGAYESLLGAERAHRPLFASPHYNFVVVDWRGRFGSKDVPVDGGVWNAQDGYTNVEWIADQAWSDGQVATWGVSALCGQQYTYCICPF